MARQPNPECERADAPCAKSEDVRGRNHAADRTIDPASCRSRPDVAALSAAARDRYADLIDRLAH